MIMFISQFGFYSSFTTVVLGLLCFILLSIFKRKVRFSNLPPGPFALPVLGNLLNFNNSEALGIQLAKWRTKYGDPLTIWFGTTPIVVANSWHAIHEATVTRKDDFNERFMVKTGEVLSQGGNGISNHNGIVWNRMRKIGVGVVRKYSESENLPINVQWAVSEGIQNFPEDGELFDPCFNLSSIMLNIAFSNVVGRRECTTEDPIFLELRRLTEEFRNFFSDSLWYDFVPIYKRFFASNTKLDFETKGYWQFLSVLQDVLNEHRKSYIEGQTRTFTDAILSIKLDAEKDSSTLVEYLDDKSICQTLMELMQGSSDTSSFGLIYLVRMLSRFPEIQNKVWEETNREIGSENLPIQSDKNKCPYTMAVIHEVLRISMLATSGFLRCAGVDTQLAGYKLQKGTAILLNYVGVTLDGNSWPEPELFDPDRFLEEDGSFKTTVPPIFLAFGTGRRNCFGGKVAILHLFVAIVLLIRNFEFVSEARHKQDARLDTLPFFVLAVPKPFQITIRRRN